MFRNLKKEQLIQSNFPFVDYSLDYALDALRRIGAREIEFYGAEPHICFFDTDYSDMKVLRRKLEDRELRVAEINPENCKYPTNLASGNPATRLHGFEFYKKAIQTAGVIGCPRVCVFPGFALADKSFEEAWGRSVESMTKLGEIAKTEGVTITFEATTPNLTVVTDHSRVMKFIKDCGCDNMAVTIDMMCLMQTGESVQDVYDICGADKIVNVHYTDGALMPNGSWEHRIPGEGQIDLDSELEMFDRNHYAGRFGCEVTWTVDPAIMGKGPEAICAKLQKWWDDHFI